jgi:hypothetical protein
MQPPCSGACVSASLYAFDDSASCAADPVTACISGAYDPRATSGRTFHRDGAFVLVGTPCGSAIATDGWDECLLDGQDQPEGCACLCREGVCPGDDDRIALAACEVTELCPHLDVEVFAPDDDVVRRVSTGGAALPVTAPGGGPPNRRSACPGGRAA